METAWTTSRPFLCLNASESRLRGLSVDSGLEAPRAHACVRRAYGLRSQIVITICSMGPRFVYQSSWGSGLPASTQGSGSTLIVANLFSFAVDGYIVGLRFARAANDDEEHIGCVFRESDNGLLGVTRFRQNAGASPTGWQHAYLRPRVPVSAGTKYYVGVSFGSQEFRYTNGALSSVDIVTGDVTAIHNTSTFWNGIFGNGFNRTGWTQAAGRRYGVDMLFLRGDLH